MSKIMSAYIHKAVPTMKAGWPVILSFQSPSLVFVEEKQPIEALLLVDSDRILSPILCYNVIMSQIVSI